MGLFDKNVPIEPQFYNYSIVFYNYQTTVLNASQYGSYRTVLPNDLSTQNTVSV